MTQTAQINGVLFAFLAVMVLLLVSCIMAVIVAPPQRPGSHRPQQRQAAAPPPPLPSRVAKTAAPPPPLPSRVTKATVPRPPLPRRRPRVTARAAGFHGRAAGDEATELGAPEPMQHDRIPWPEVSSRPPWGPAPKPSGVDG